METAVSISTQQFKKLLEEDRVNFILDLREEDEFAAWRIEGRREIPAVNIPKVEFVGEEESYLDRLQHKEMIYVICAHGDSSRYAAKWLSERGYPARSLEGGMDAWSELYETNRICEQPAIYQFYRVAKGCITHIIIDGGEAAVIDPVRNIQPLIPIAAQAGARIPHVIDTHLQADHISGGAALAAATGARYLLNPGDAAGGMVASRPLEDGMTLRVGKYEIAALHSPGHTPGSVSLLLDKRFLFTGDTIMKTSLGRPDLGGHADEWAALLYETIFQRFAPLPDTITILPTHAASMKEQDGSGAIMTAMGTTRQKDELFRLTEKADFIRRVKESIPQNPERYADIRRVNLGLLNPDEAKRKELEIGKNLCGMAARK